MAVNYLNIRMDYVILVYLLKKKYFKKTLLN